MFFRDKAIISLDSVDSTNNYAANLIKLSLPPEGTVITAQVQTSGRGQRQSFWESAEGDNILCSFILYPRFIQASDQFAISQMVSLAIRETAEELTSQTCHIKWPNDIICRDKKISGILIETSWVGSKISYCIAGIGLNINQANFECHKAISARQITGHPMDKEAALMMLIENIEKYYFKLKSGQLREINLEYHKHLYRLGIPTRFIFEEKEITATIQGVDHLGRLKLMLSDNSHITCDLKEISMIM
ncbi:MAG: biotin--[acetyl-CoA-carboxylase] ligase [Flavobacteriales bacterium]|nr:biotin--[acetyl-CoA-carboxylase] ligase [Flavobacteriales bacterium]